MKYINLLPAESQPGITVNRRGTILSSKTVIGCLAIPVLMFVVFFGGMMLFQYQYKRKIEKSIRRRVPSPATVQTKPLTVPPKAAIKSRAATKPPTPSKMETLSKKGLLPKRMPLPQKEPPQIAEKKVSPAMVSPKTHPSRSGMANKKESGYTLRLASFTTQDEAEALMQKIRKQKLEPYQQVKQITKNINTVYIDQSSTMKEAMGLTRALEADGFEAFIKIRHQGAYWVGVKSFSSWVKAQELAEQLAGLGYSAKVVPEQIPLTVYWVNLGHYQKYRPAKLMQNQLEEQGYHPISVIAE